MAIRAHRGMPARTVGSIVWRRCETVSCQKIAGRAASLSYIHVCFIEQMPSRMPSRMVCSLFFTLGLLLVGGPLGCRAGSSDRTGPIKIAYFPNLPHAQAGLGWASA